MFKECLKNNIFPFIIEDNLKGEYYKALNNTQTEDNCTSLINFCNKEQEYYFNNIKSFVYTSEELEKLIKDL